MTHVWTTADGVKGAAMLVLQRSLRIAQHDDGRCWPSLAYLADRSRYGRAAQFSGQLRA